MVRSVALMSLDARAPLTPRSLQQSKSAGVSQSMGNCSEFPSDHICYIHDFTNEEIPLRARITDALQRIKKWKWQLVGHILHESENSWRRTSSGDHELDAAAWNTENLKSRITIRLPKNIPHVNSVNSAAEVAKTST
ncbi:hypothetical protein EVAR_56194_1 [Eumeta japonica]|uniref:Uncharacterized protein n=1 Tax=Eumeta variegata TaxID=151549 RepID=A0A4C1Y795_EUMVA|nr:hypothetical protein EVAR_56194_1 [Eumeta japonica]